MGTDGGSHRLRGEGAAVQTEAVAALPRSEALREQAREVLGSDAFAVVLDLDADEAGDGGVSAD